MIKKQSNISLSPPHISFSLPRKKVRNEELKIIKMNGHQSKSSLEEEYTHSGGSKVQLDKVIIEP